ncbi:MAG: single-stranded DNA-binding protein [Elusimicrobia bacterium]|nr:single-stranded DNA-binding protein [Elusimicrobiota bacterium]
MASNANLVVLMGNLTRNPELRYTPKGRAVTTLNLAINRRYKDRETGEFVQQTDYVPVSVWGSLAENCDKYLAKGRGVYIEGRLSLKKWEDASGESRSRLEVVARNVQFLGSASSAGKGAPAKASAEAYDDNVDTDEELAGSGVSEAGSDDDDEEIPF